MFYIEMNLLTEEKTRHVIFCHFQELKSLELFLLDNRSCINVSSQVGVLDQNCIPTGNMPDSFKHFISLSIFIMVIHFKIMLLIIFITISSMAVMKPTVSGCNYLFLRNESVIFRSTILWVIWFAK